MRVTSFPLCFEATLLRSSLKSWQVWSDFSLRLNYESSQGLRVILFVRLREDILQRPNHLICWNLEFGQPHLPGKPLGPLPEVKATNFFSAGKKSGAQSFSPFRFRKVSESFSGNVHFCILLHLFENGSVCFIFSFCESQISLPESNFKDERDLHFGSVFRFSGPEFFRLVGKFVSPEAKKWRRQLLFGLCLLSLPIFFPLAAIFGRNFGLAE